MLALSDFGSHNIRVHLQYSLFIVVVVWRVAFVAFL